jgi:DNA-binding LytR/AlgR family response regulator
MSTRVLIVEDETLAANRLARMIQTYLHDTAIFNYCDSKASAVVYLRVNPCPDLIFLDIQLGDGLCFDIFKDIEVNSPVIFTTAYDEFALKAFELNSIDYLLKPISEEKLKNSLIKYERLQKQMLFQDFKTNYNALLSEFGVRGSTYKKRFLIAIGDKLISLTTSEIAYFCSIEKSTFLVDFNGMHYGIEFSLDKLEEILDPNQFFRVNRQYLVSTLAIDKMILLSKSRIKLRLKPLTKETVLVSSTRTPAFRSWLDR